MTDNFTPMTPHSSQIITRANKEASSFLVIRCSSDVRIRVTLDPQATLSHRAEGTINIDFTLHPRTEEHEWRFDTIMPTREDMITRIAQRGTLIAPQEVTREKSDEPELDWAHHDEASSDAVETWPSVQFTDPHMAECLISAPHLAGFFDHSTFRKVINMSHGDNGLIRKLSSDNVPTDATEQASFTTARHTVLHDHLTGVAHHMLREAYNKYHATRDDNITKIIERGRHVAENTWR